MLPGLECANFGLVPGYFTPHFEALGLVGHATNLVVAVSIRHTVRSSGGYLFISLNSGVFGNAVRGQ